MESLSRASEIGTGPGEEHLTAAGGRSPRRVDWTGYKCNLCGRDLAQKAESCVAYPAHRAASGEHDPIGEKYLHEEAVRLGLLSE